MPIFTYLRDNPHEDENLPSDVLELLNEVREKTGKNWRIQRQQCYKKQWFKKPILVEYWSLYCHTCSIEYQEINFWGGKSTIGLSVSLDLIVAYLFGIVTGLNYGEADHH